MRTFQQALLPAILALSAALLLAQAPAAKGPGPGKGAPRVVFSVTSTSFPDGGEIPMKHAGVGENKSPEFTFHWTAANNPAPTPEALQSYAVIFHDIENSTNRTAADTLHWQAFNIPGTAKGLPEALGVGDLPDGTRNGAGALANRPNGTPGYFGPGAGVGPFHHYIFEFFALDTKLTLEAKATRDELIKAMEGHIIGKAVYVGRYHAVQ